jgi:hypothetical protein
MSGCVRDGAVALFGDSCLSEDIHEIAAASHTIQTDGRKSWVQ